MKIFFVGTVEFSKKSLQKLVSLKANIVGVATKSKSDFNSDFADLAEVCEENNIEYKFLKDINAPETISWIKDLKPDIIFCFGWSSLIKSELLKLSPMGIIGFHPSELPMNRGRHPLIWSLVLGLERGASTFFFMDEGADSGDILSQKIFEIKYEDDAGTLYDKLIAYALKQIECFLPELQNNTYKRLKQDNFKANYWRKRSAKDGEINFKMNSYSIYNLVRGLTKPYVGSHIIYKEEEVKIWKAEEVDCDLINLEPGKVLEVVGNTVLVKTNDGAIRLLEHEFKQLPNKGEYL